MSLSCPDVRVTCRRSAQAAGVAGLGVLHEDGKPAEQTASHDVATAIACRCVTNGVVLLATLPRTCARIWQGREHPACSRSDRQDLIPIDRVARIGQVHLTYTLGTS